MASLYIHLLGERVAQMVLAVFARNFISCGPISLRNFFHSVISAGIRFAIGLPDVFDSSKQSIGKFSEFAFDFDPTWLNSPGQPEMARTPRYNLNRKGGWLGNLANRVSSLKSTSRWSAADLPLSNKSVPTQPVINGSEADHLGEIADKHFKSCRHLEIAALRKLQICLVGENVAADYQQLVYDAKDSAQFRFCETEQEAMRLARTSQIDAWILCADSASSWCIDLCSTIRTLHNDAVICLVFENYSAQAEQLGWLSGASLFVPRPMLIDWVDSWVATTRKQPDPQHNMQQQLSDPLLTRQKLLPVGNVPERK